MSTHTSFNQHQRLAALLQKCADRSTHDIHIGKVSRIQFILDTIESCKPPTEIRPLVLECISLTNVGSLDRKDRKELHRFCRQLVQETAPVDRDETINVARLFPELLPDLIEAGANPDFKDEWGDTPFWHAICQATDLQDALGTKDAIDAYKKLIDLGAYHATEFKGNDILDILVSVDMEPYLFEVMDYGISKNTHMASELLYRACNIKNPEVSIPAAQIALTHGADPTQSHPKYKDSSITFLDDAKESGDVQLLSLLEKFVAEKQAHTLNTNTQLASAVRSRRI